MKHIIYLALLVVLLSNAACKKSKVSGPAAEAPIVFTMKYLSTGANIDTTTAGNISVSSSYAVVVTLTSAMPSSTGINIVATVSDITNSSATIAQNGAINSTTAINNITLINLPRQHDCVVTLKVTSVATASNLATKTFHVVYK